MNNFNPYNNYNWGYDPYGQQYPSLNPNQNGYLQSSQAEDHTLSVNGVEGAKAAAKKPNSDYIFRDINKKGIVYVVVTDATGLATVESYKLQGPVVPDEVQAERDKWSDINKRLSRLEKAVLKDDKSRQNLQ